MTDGDGGPPEEVAPPAPAGGLPVLLAALLLADLAPPTIHRSPLSFSIGYRLV